MKQSYENESTDFDLIDAESLRRMGRLLWRNAWIIILVGLFAGLAAFLFSHTQAPVYEARAQILVSRPATQGQAVDITQAMTSQQITQTYVEMFRLPSVREAAAERLQVDIQANQIFISALTNTQLIEIRVEDTIPSRASAAADTMVDVLIAKNEEIQSARFIASEQSLNAQIIETERQIAEIQEEIKTRSAIVVEEQKTRFENQISSVKAEIAGLERELLMMAPENSQADDKRAQIEQLRSLQRGYENTYNTLRTQNRASSSDDEELAQLERTFNLYQQIYLNLLNNREALRLARLQSTLGVAPIDAAQINPIPIRPRTNLNTMLGGLAGVILAISVVFLRDFMDDTIKSREDVKRLFGLSTLGQIPEHETPAEVGLFIASQPRSPVSETYRALRTNLEFSAVDLPLKTILVTSAGPSEGKSTVAANLAGALAQAGKKVLLLDTDLRRPRIHQYLGLGNRFGLSDLFIKPGKLSEIIQPYEGPNNTTFEVVTTGGIPPNPGELLGSDRMKAILEEATARAEIVIIDSAPSLVADSQAISANVDGVLIVIEAGETHVEPVRSLLESLHRTKARILGLVLNRLKAHHGNYNGYYSGYYHTDEEELSHGKKLHLKMPWKK
ncbi:MAG: polysaccharide biosynthesis tyrosine autokinase [Bacteroidetes bacterium]|nr:polysaccharide biosynthesis tyrosine autokinase [Bacteroidota bacterium]